MKFKEDYQPGVIIDGNLITLKVTASDGRVLVHYWRNLTKEATISYKADVAPIEAVILAGQCFVPTYSPNEINIEVFGKTVYFEDYGYDEYETFDDTEVLNPYKSTERH